MRLLALAALCCASAFAGSGDDKPAPALTEMERALGVKLIDQYIDQYSQNFLPFQAGH